MHQLLSRCSRHEYRYMFQLRGVPPDASTMSREAHAGADGHPVASCRPDKAVASAPMVLVTPKRYRKFVKRVPAVSWQQEHRWAAK